MTSRELNKIKNSPKAVINKGDMKEKDLVDEIDYKFLLDAYHSNYETIKSNNDLFESKTTYIAAGLIVLSFAFIENKEAFEGCYSLAIFVAGIGCSMLALALNLWSFFYGNKLMREDSEIIAAKIKIALSLNLEKENDDTRERSRKIIRKINRWNKATLCFLLAGMLLMLIFTLNHISN